MEIRFKRVSRENSIDVQVFDYFLTMYTDEQKSQGVNRKFESARSLLTVNREVQFIINENMTMGFFVIERKPTPYGDYDYVITDIYIHPKYRKKGLAKLSVSEWLAHNGGSYLIIMPLNNNNGIIEFWKKIASRRKCFEIPLPTEMENKLFYAFKTPVTVV